MLQPETFSGVQHLSRYGANGSLRLCYYDITQDNGLNPPTQNSNDDPLFIASEYDALNRLVEIDDDHLTGATQVTT